MNTNPKRFETLRAQAALAGIELRSVRNDAERWTFVAASGAVTVEIPTLEEVETWLDQVVHRVSRERGEVA